MIFRQLSQFFSGLAYILYRPLWVLSFCLIVIVINLFWSHGGLFQLWSLYRNGDEMSQRIANLKEEVGNLSMKIKRISDPDFLELEANNYFDVVEKGDIIFVFSHDGKERNSEEKNLGDIKSGDIKSENIERRDLESRGL